MKTTIVLPNETLEKLDDLADEIDINRSELMTDILGEVLTNRDDVIDDLYEDDDEEDEEASSD